MPTLSSIRIVFAAALLAATPALALPAPEAVLLDGSAALQISGSELEGVSISEVAVEGQPFSNAVAVSVPDGLANFWGAALHATVDEPIAEGDTLLATFSLRCTESMTGEGQVQFDFEENHEPYDKSASQVAYAPNAWATFQVPFSAAKDYAAGESHAAFQLGFGRQSVEIGGFRLENFGSDVAVADLPRTKQKYPGMEDDAPWRAEAAERIDRLRKADLTVAVIDADGAPVEGAEVHAAMTKHAFPFGSAVTSDLLTGTDPEAKRYQSEVARLFSEIVFENDLKWNNHGFGSLEKVDAALTWLADHGLTARGHTLIWPSWQYVPEGLEALKDDPAALRAAIEDRITSAASRWSGRLVNWDVANEIYTNHDLQDVLGEGSVAEWFRLAKSADPHATLYLNDYGILTTGPSDSAHQRGYFDQITGLLDAGAPVEGIGMQGHFSAMLTGPERLLEITDRFASFGLPIKVTEFDITLNDPELQAAYLRDFYTAMFSHEAVEGIMMWGFWSGAHWRPGAALFDEDFQPRPHGTAYEDLVLGDWWTDETATTNASGEATVRGFLGEHEVSVTVDGETTTTAATLEQGGSSLTVHLR